jgi:HSP20 family protein
MQTKNAFEVKADLPGVEKKDIKVNVEGDVLTISHEHAARKEDKKEDNGVKYHVSCLSLPRSATSPCFYAPTKARSLHSVCT